jgi:hypothetical protein
MALQLNLLHEQFSEQRQRQRDPLKLGIYALVGFGLILFLWYGWNAYETVQIRSHLKAAEAEWAKVEPKVTAAQKRAEELGKIINSTKILDGLIDQRFYWAPLLGKLAACVAPNIQLIGFEGNVSESGEAATLVIEGISAAREPRAAAEQFRQSLNETLTKNYTEVKVAFRNLEDLDTLATLAGVPTRTSRFVLNVSFNPKPPEPGAASAETPTPEVTTK